MYSSLYTATIFFGGYSLFYLTVWSIDFLQIEYLILIFFLPPKTNQKESNEYHRRKGEEKNFRLSRDHYGHVQMRQNNCVTC